MDKLHKVGAFWKPKEDARSKGTGEVTINGMKQKFVMLPNSYKDKQNDPDYNLMSSNEPEVDEWAAKREAHSKQVLRDATPEDKDPPF
tara:strand:- start:12 stop:275 length:264 start_codon:yes stop_codon:yes gene_type:complete